MRIKPKALVNRVQLVQDQAGDTPPDTRSNRRGSSSKTLLQRFNPLRKSTRPQGPQRQQGPRRPRRSGPQAAGSPEPAEQNSNVDESLPFMLGEKEDERSGLTAPLKLDQRSTQQQPHSRDGDLHEFNRKRMRDGVDPLSKKAEEEFSRIVQAYLDNILRVANDPKHLEACLAATAESLLALRDSKAENNVVNISLTHAVLSIVRQFLKNENTVEISPKKGAEGIRMQKKRDLEKIRDLLVSISPKGVSAQALRNYHLKIPLILLNLCRPRKGDQRISAILSISTLLRGMS